MRPEAGRAPGDVGRRGAPRARRPSAAPRRSRAGRRARPKLARRRRRKPGPGRRDRLSRAAGRRSGAKLGHPGRPRGERVALREAELDPLQRRVALRKRRRVLLRNGEPSRLQPPRGPVEVGPAGGRAALHDREPVGREDQRRELAAQELRRGQACTVELGALRRRPVADSLTLTSRGPAAAKSRLNATSARPLSPKRTSCPSARVRGEKPCVPTWSASSRFVFPAPFSPVTSTIPGDRSRSRKA